MAEVDDAAVAVGEHLHLDVAGVADEALDEQAAVAEGLLRLAAAAAQAPRELLRAGRRGACRARRRRPRP